MNKYFTQIILLSLLLVVQSLDNTTLSNYKNISITKLEGLFFPDFEEKIVKGNLTYTFQANVDDSNIILDTKNLLIESIKDADNGQNLTYTVDKKDEILGDPLVISKEYKKDDIIKINIEYTTTKNGTAAQFLSKEQTFGGEHEYFFTLSVFIHGRELFPCQDTPAVKAPFYLGIKVKNEFRGMISGLLDKEESIDENNKIYYYKQDIPIASYLISLVAGDIEERQISENISVYTEPAFMEKAYNELTDLPQILEKAISYMGDYVWGKYNVLILPKFFPYSGMENPCLTFCSPCLINGDKSLVDIVAHELIHSWSGNLVTNENWRDFWLNEGITMFLQRKIVGMWKNDVDYAKMDGYLGTFNIDYYLDYFGENSTFTTLRPNLTGINPDDSFSDIPYEKGYNFMLYIENLIGDETMKTFFQRYFVDFKEKSIDFYDFKNYFIDFCKEEGVSDEIVETIDWNAWVFEPGRCPVDNDFSNHYKIEVDDTLDKFIKGEIDEELEQKFNNWTHTSKTAFMTLLYERVELLTDKQHDFFTKTLKLYTGQNFLISTNYFGLILSKTDKFYENEEEGLIDYLSNYGALDYMRGFYDLFYKRDEVKAVETLDKLRTCYHPLLLNQADEEIENAKKTFPILTFELKNKEQCLFLSNNTKIEITADEYNLNETIEILDGVYLESDTVATKLSCSINNKEKYCSIRGTLPDYGTFILKVPNRIQKEKYAVKVYNSKFNITAYGKEVSIDKTQTKSNYDIDYKNNDTHTIKLYFENEPDNNIKVLYNKETEVECLLDKKVMDCLINNTIFKYVKDKKNEYNLKLIDFCGNEKYSFTVNVKNSSEPAGDKDDNGSIKLWVIIIIVLGIIVVIIAAILIYRTVNKKDINIEMTQEEKEAKLMSEL